MKTSSQKTVNTLLALFVFMVLLPGQNTAHALETAPRTQAKAQLHIPWNLLSERLRAAINRQASDASKSAEPIGNHLISVPYQTEQLNWNLASGSVSAQVTVDAAQVAPASATVSLSKSSIHVVLDQISLDQVIDRTVDGVTVHLHLIASCGPIVLDQTNASAASTFTLDWSSGAPVAKLSSLDLSWAPNSWSFNAFTCTGPSGVDQQVRDGLSTFLRDPAALKPYVQSYVSANLQSSIDEAISQLRTPFTASNLTLQVGTLSPASTGVLADLTLSSSVKASPLPALPVPSHAVLSLLATDEPVLIGGVDVIEFLVDSKLAAQDKYFKVDLQKVDGFHKLMHSRIEQLFVWGDLWNYPEDNPFYLNVANPRAVALTRQGSALATDLSLSALIQSYRDKQWWTYVTSKGQAAASVALKVSNGTLAYSTTINSISLHSGYGSAYSARYHKGKSTLPDSVVSKAITGPQTALSGSMQWPDVQLGEAGSYRASSFKWVDASTFSLGFTSL